MMALEIAIDEMAEKLGLDPIEFRILNDTQVDPEHPKRPFSQRQFIECLRIGAEQFGWSQAQPAARHRRATGAGSIGIGVAAAFRNNLLADVRRAGAARQSRHGDGRDRHDRHRHRQLHHHRADRGRDDGRAARQGGGAPRRFRLSGLGRLRRPVRRQQLDVGRLCGLRQAARGGGAEARLQFRRCDIRRRPGALRQSQRAARRSGAASGGLAAEDTIEYGDLDKTYQQSTFGAHFVEVAVDAATGEITACAACSRCAPRAASSIRNRRAAR